MITRTIFAGFGGQGVLLMGYVLSHGGMLKGLNVTYLPAYGAAMRGGTANCTITLADEEVASPVASEPDYLVAMNYPSMEKFEPSLKSGGLIFLNSSLIPENPRRSDVEAVRVPAVELAQQAGSDRAANMVMIGAVTAKTGFLTLEETIKGMETALKGKKKFFELNRKGIELGADFILKGE